MSSEFTTDLVPYAPPSVGASGSGRGIDVVRMLRLRAPLMLAVTALVAIPAVIGVWLVVPKEYTAAEKLQFASEDPVIMYDINRGESTTRYERYVNNSVALVNDPKFLSRVLFEPAVRNLPQVQQQLDKIQFLQDHLDARTIPRTEFIEIQGTFDDRDVATTVVSTVVTQLWNQALRQESSFKQSTNATLLKEQEDLQKKYNEQLARIQQLRGQIQAPYLGLTGIGGTSDALRTLLGSAEEELSTARMEQQAAERQIEELTKLEEERKSGPGKEIYLFNVEAQAKADPQVVNLRGQEMALKAEIDGSNWGPENLMRRQREAQLKSIQGQMSKALGEARRMALTAQMQLAQQNLEMAKAKVTAAETRVKEYEGRVTDEQGKATQLVEAEQRIALEEDELGQIKLRLTEIRDRLYQSDVESKAPPRVSRPADGAMTPVRPNHGKRIKLAFMAFVGAAGLGFGAGLLRELTDQQLRSSEDLTPITPLPVLASIPHISADRLPAHAQAETLMGEYPTSATVEEFRRILSRIIYPPEGAAEIKTVLVTSPSKGDGKTSLACNLGIALAEANRRVLIVDISGRRPGVEPSFGMEPDGGLSEILSGEFVAEEVIRETEHPHLCVLGPGLRSHEIGGKLASREMLDFFEGAEHAFDHVIIDTPPCLLMSDAKLLAPVMDGVILVAGVGVSTTKMVRRCLLDMQHGGANVIGIVLNGIRPARGGYLRRQQDAFYDYGPNGNGNGNGHGTNGADAHVRPATKEDEDLPAMILLSDDSEKTRDQSKEL